MSGRLFGRCCWGPCWCCGLGAGRGCLLGAEFGSRESARKMIVDGPVGLRRRVALLRRRGGEVDEGRSDQRWAASRPFVGLGIVLAGIFTLALRRCWRGKVKGGRLLDRSLNRRLLCLFFRVDEVDKVELHV